MTIQTMSTDERRIGNQAKDASAGIMEVDQCVSERLASLPLRFLFQPGVLDVWQRDTHAGGCVPTLNLKEDLEKRLAGVHHVERIVDEVDVICADAR